MTPVVQQPCPTGATTNSTVNRVTIEETNALPTQTSSTETEPSGNEKDVTPLIAGVAAGMLVLVAMLTVIVLALGIFIKATKKSIANRNTRMKENDAYSTTQDIVTARNESYAHSAEMKENTAYNLPSKINTSINECYAHSAEMKEIAACASTESYAKNNY